MRRTFKNSLARSPIFRSPGGLEFKLATGALALVVLVNVVGCASQPNFGTLPEVKLTYDADPAPPAPPAERPAPPEPTKLVATDLPDPVAIRTEHQVKLTLAYREGQMSLVQHEALTLKQPVLTARRVGRFSVELWIGQELIERVRFDFPLLATGGDPALDRQQADLEAGLQTTAIVQVPEAPRATEIRVLDRLTRKEIRLPWPLGEGASDVSPPSSKAAPRGATEPTALPEADASAESGLAAPMGELPAK